MATQWMPQDNCLQGFLKLNMIQVAMIRTYPSANAEGLISIHVIYNDFCLQAEQKQKVRRPTTWYHWTNNISGDRHTPMDLLECQRIYGAIAPTDPFRPEESNGEEWDMRDARGLPISYTIISFTYRLQDPFILSSDCWNVPTYYVYTPSILYRPWPIRSSTCFYRVIQDWRLAIQSRRLCQRGWRPGTVLVRLLFLSRWWTERV